jgi:hypothetical protein
MKQNESYKETYYHYYLVAQYLPHALFVYAGVLQTHAHTRGNAFFYRAMNAARNADRATGFLLPQANVCMSRGILFNRNPVARSAFRAAFIAR